MKTKHGTIILLLITTLLGLGGKVNADEAAGAANRIPVAIVSAVVGEEASLKKTAQDPGRKLYWLEPLYTGDIVTTTNSTTVTITYLYDRSKWVLKPQAEAQIKLNRPTTHGLFDDKLTEKKSRSYTQSFDVASLLTEPVLTTLSNDNETNDATENVQLAAYVDTGIYPPVFRWAPNSMSDYKLSIFDERGQLLHSFDVEGESFDYPHHREAPLRLTKGAKYFWQVEDIDGNLIVNRYPFSPLTRIQIKELNHYQYRLTEADPTTYVDLLLAQMQHGALDKYLHLLERMAKIDPENPQLKSLLAGSYVKRGAPRHAKKLVESLHSQTAP